LASASVIFLENPEGIGYGTWTNNISLVSASNITVTYESVDYNIAYVTAPIGAILLVQLMYSYSGNGITNSYGTLLSADSSFTISNFLAQINGDDSVYPGDEEPINIYTVVINVVSVPVVLSISPSLTMFGSGTLDIYFLVTRVG